MSRIHPLSIAEAAPQAQYLLGGINAKLGMVPNLYRTVAHSPAALSGLLGFSDALSKGTLSARFREQIALVVAETNGCDYCLSAHTAIGSLLKLNPDEIQRNRQGHASDARTEAGLQFAQALTVKHGVLTDSDFDAVRAAGYSDPEISEIIANVALNVFTNYFNIAADVEVDFPRVHAAASTH